jgi:hypothetical protein
MALPRPLTALGVALLLASGCTGADEPEAAVAESRDALAAAPKKGFTFARDTTENPRSVPITKGGDFFVVYSVPIDGLSPDERIAVRGEVTLSLCEPSEGAPCQRDTPFAPHLVAKIVLGTSATDASGTALSGASDLSCSRRDHHCTLVVGEHITKNLTGKRFANLVVSAQDAAATSKDLMIVEDTHGGVDVTRIGASANADGRSFTGKDVAPKTMTIDNVDQNGNGPRRDGYVTLRARVDGVKPGDIVDADAVILAKVDDGSCDPLIAHQVWVSKDDHGDPSAKGNALVALTAHNGTNCLDASCRYEKSGAGQLPPGTPSTVFVTVVSKAGRSCVQPGDQWHLAASSALRVRVR